MFFLSKLFPRLLYPVGMTSLLIALAAAIVLRWPSIARTCCLIAFSVLFLASNRWVNFALVRPLEDSYLSSVSPSTADAIVILGGGVAPAFQPRRNVHLTIGDRLLYAAMLYRSHKAPLVVVTGTIVPWRESESTEGKSTSQVLVLMGVPPSAIVVEPPSSNTYQEANAVKKVMRTHNLHRILLVTSAMHMPRAFRTFRHQGIDSIPSPTDFAVTDDDVAQSDATFEEFALSLTRDVNVLAITTAALKEYIGLVYYWARDWL
jgi:uncharacterized SAM-binding protein YcdF (DUF218 family)